jgi:hypothetical protein
MRSRPPAAPSRRKRLMPERPVTTSCSARIPTHGPGHGEQRAFWRGDLRARVTEIAAASISRRRRIPVRLHTEAARVVVLFVQDFEQNVVVCLLHVPP